MPEWIHDANLVFWGAITIMAFGPVIMHYLYKWHKTSLEMELKREMVARGMSADDICRVLRAPKGRDAEEIEPREEPAG
jgi:hypothetical protein